MSIWEDTKLHSDVFGGYECCCVGFEFEFE